MSKTVPVTFADQLLWAYDVSFAVLLMEAVAVAVETTSGANDAFDRLLDDLRRQAMLGANSAFDLGGWDEDQQRSLLGWIAEAGRRLRERGSISASEAQIRYVIYGDPIELRGADLIDTTTVADLAVALVSFAEGTLAAPPAPARAWYFGIDGGPSTIGTL